MQRLPWEFFVLVPLFVLAGMVVERMLMPFGEPLALAVAAFVAALGIYFGARRIAVASFTRFVLATAGGAATIFVIVWWLR